MTSDGCRRPLPPNQPTYEERLAALVARFEERCAYVRVRIVDGQETGLQAVLKQSKRCRASEAQNRSRYM
jgi:hypothetical protein